MTRAASETRPETVSGITTKYCLMALLFFIQPDLIVTAGIAASKRVKERVEEARLCASGIGVSVGGRNDLRSRAIDRDHPKVERPASAITRRRGDAR